MSFVKTLMKKTVNCLKTIVKKVSGFFKKHENIAKEMAKKTAVVTAIISSFFCIGKIVWTIGYCKGYDDGYLRGDEHGYQDGRRDGFSFMMSHDEDMLGRLDSMFKRMNKNNTIDILGGNNI